MMRNRRRKRKCKPRIWREKNTSRQVAFLSVDDNIVRFRVRLVSGEWSSHVACLPQPVFIERFAPCG